MPQGKMLTVSVSASIVPGVTGNRGKICDVIAITQKLLKACVCLADVFCFKTVIQSDHGLNSIRLHGSVKQQVQRKWRYPKPGIQKLYAAGCLGLPVWHLAF